MAKKTRSTVGGSTVQRPAAEPARSDTSQPPQPLTGIEPFNPPRRNPWLLALTLAAFAIWLAVLVWLALN